MKKVLSVIAMVGFVFGLFVATGLCQPAMEKAIETAREIQIVAVSGIASVQKAGVDEIVPAVVGDALKQGDTLMTGPMSSMDLSVDGDEDTAMVKVSENAELTFTTLTGDQATNTKNTILDLAIGSVLIKASKLEGDSKFEVNTPTSIVGVRGTTFEVSVSAME